MCVGGGGRISCPALSLDLHKRDYMSHDGDIERNRQGAVSVPGSEHAWKQGDRREERWRGG